MMTFFFGCFLIFEEEKCSVLLLCSQRFAPFGEDGETEAECGCTRLAAAALHLPTHLQILRKELCSSFWELLAAMGCCAANI